MTARILMVGNDGNQIQFFDITDVSPETLEKAGEHFSERQKMILRITREQGYSPSQQFALAVPLDGVFRTFEIMSKI